MDLFQSFTSGRLYNQVETMVRYYEIPVLLIEFSQDKSFSFQVPSASNNPKYLGYLDALSSCYASCFKQSVTISTKFPAVDSF